MVRTVGRVRREIAWKGLVFFACVAMGELLQAQPTNDHFANRVIISGTNLVIFADNINATRESREPYTGAAPGGHSVWWQWTAPAAGLATLTTTGSDFDTVLGIYNGTPLLPWLKPITDNDDEAPGNLLTSKVTFYPDPGETYYIAVDGYDETQQGNIQLNLHLTPPEPMASWSLLDPYGAYVHSTNFAGKVVILNFWATWCSPCLREIPEFVSLQDKYRADGLVIIGANSGESASTVASFLATTNINYQIVLAGPLSAKYIPAGFIPTTYIINRQNIIVREDVGTQYASVLEQEILPLLYYNYLKLDYQKSGDQLTLRWPTNTLPTQLESAGSLNNLVWSPWPTPPTTTNGINTVLVNRHTNLFFRLRLQF